MSEILRAEKISKRFKIGDKYVDALNSVDLSFSKGECVSIMGPSGSGKSTLLYLLGLIDTLSMGHIYFNGQKISSLSSRKKAHFRSMHIGFIFQSFYLLPELNCLQNVCLPAFIQDKKNFWKKNEFAKKARNMLIKVGLEERILHKPTELSGGEMQRVAICRSLMNEPSVILADEPTGNLDSKNSDMIANMLQSISKKENKTVIIATHNESLAHRADKIVILKDGMIQ